MIITIHKNPEFLFVKPLTPSHALIDFLFNITITYHPESKNVKDNALYLVYARSGDRILPGYRFQSEIFFFSCHSVGCYATNPGGSLGHAVSI